MTSKFKSLNCNIWDQQKSNVHCILFTLLEHFIDFTLNWFLHWTFLRNPAAAPCVAHTILTKHQAFAPSGPMRLNLKFKFINVEFFLKDSAKAWQEKSDGPWVKFFWSKAGSF